MILFCAVSVQDGVEEVNTDDFEMNMVLLKTWICSRITDIPEGKQIQIRKNNNYGWGRCNFQDEKMFVEWLGGHERWCLHAFCRDTVDPLV